MSSASIAEITSYFVGNVGSDNSKAATGAGQDTFSRVFDKTNGEKTPAPETAKTARADGESIQNHANIQKKNGPENLREKQNAAEEMLEEEKLKEAAEEMGAQMVQEVADTFKVTVEEVEQVMEELGMTPLDLLAGEKLTRLVLALNPEADSLSIMTDEQLFADLKSLMNTARDLVNQLAQEFQLGQEQMTELMAGLQEQATAVLQAGLPEEVPVELTQEDLSTVGQPQDEPELELILGKRTPQQENQQLEGEQLVTVTLDRAGREKSQSGTNNQSAGGQQTGESFTANMMNQLSQAVDEAAGTGTGYGISGQELINQITEHIKLNVKADTTEMELQLNPASLGSLKVQISSKAGVLTASFITENEAVKAAIESQMIQLKESFEQQGLKVEAVEVNVETRGFERSLDQHEQEQNEFQEQAKKSGRRITLTGLEGVQEDLLTEELSEGDRIIADMMVRNGNTVDYTA